MKESLTPGTTISHYRIESFLGAGGMGEVYVAYDSVLDRVIALKILPCDSSRDQKVIRRFRHEARTASALNHPNIVVIHEVGATEDGRPFIAMEYVKGQLLEAKIAGRSMDAGEIIEIGVQVADALEEAHGKGIFHRDIKPANIVIGPRGRVKLLDFGLAKVNAASRNRLGNDRDTRLETSHGTVMGTVRYMSPEQALGHPVDHRTDIFSLGIVLYEMSTGRPPFFGANPFETIDQIVHSKPISISHLNARIPTDLVCVVNKCLEKNPEHRYPSARDLGLDLQRLKREYGRKTDLRLSDLLSQLRLVLLLLLILPIHEAMRRLQKTKAPSPKKRLVVLPFSEATNNPTENAFRDGLIETISRRLSQLEQFRGSLQVIPVIDAEKRGVKSASQAARELGANLVLTGDMQCKGDSFRLTLNLVDAKTLQQLRSTVDIYPLPHTVVIEDEIVSRVANMLQTELQSDTESMSEYQPKGAWRQLMSNAPLIDLAGRAARLP